METQTYDAVFQPYQAGRFTVEIEGKDKNGQATYKLQKVVAKLAFFVGTKTHILLASLDVSDTKGEEYTPGLTVGVTKDLRVEISQSAKPLLGKDNCIAVVADRAVSTNGDLAVAAIDVLAKEYEPFWFKNKVEPMSLLLKALYEAIKTEGESKVQKISCDDLVAVFASVNKDPRVKQLGDTPLMTYCRGAESMSGKKEATAPTKA
jgi:hypothetical protein